MKLNTTPRGEEEVAGVGQENNAPIDDVHPQRKNLPSVDLNDRRDALSGQGDNRAVYTPLRNRAGIQGNQTDDDAEQTLSAE